LALLDSNVSSNVHNDKLSFLVEFKDFPPSTGDLIESSNCVPAAVLRGDEWGAKARQIGRRAYLGDFAGGGLGFGRAR
jgi:hypothetical protein